MLTAQTIVRFPVTKLRVGSVTNPLLVDRWFDIHWPQHAKPSSPYGRLLQTVANLVHPRRARLQVFLERLIDT